MYIIRYIPNHRQECNYCRKIFVPQMVAKSNDYWGMVTSWNECGTDAHGMPYATTFTSLDSTLGFGTLPCCTCLIIPGVGKYC